MWAVPTPTTGRPVPLPSAPRQLPRSEAFTRAVVVLRAPMSWRNSSIKIVSCNFKLFVFCWFVCIFTSIHLWFVRYNSFNYAFLLVIDCWKNLFIINCFHICDNMSISLVLPVFVVVWVIDICILTRPVRGWGRTTPAPLLPTCRPIISSPPPAWGQYRLRTCRPSRLTPSGAGKWETIPAKCNGINIRISTQRKPAVMRIIKYKPIPWMKVLGEKSGGNISFLYNPP